MNIYNHKRALSSLFCINRILREVFGISRAGIEVRIGVNDNRITIIVPKDYSEKRSRIT